MGWDLPHGHPHQFACMMWCPSTENFFPRMCRDPVTSSHHFMPHLGILKYQSLPAARGRELILRIVRIHGACCLDKSRIHFLHLESCKFNVISIIELSEILWSFPKTYPWLRKLYTRPRLPLNWEFPTQLLRSWSPKDLHDLHLAPGRSSKRFPMKRKSLRLQQVGPHHPCQWTMVVPKSAQQKPHGPLEKNDRTGGYKNRAVSSKHQTGAIPIRPSKLHKYSTKGIPTCLAIGCCREPKAQGTLHIQQTTNLLQ